MLYVYTYCVTHMYDTHVHYSFSCACRAGLKYACRLRHSICSQQIRINEVHSGRLRQSKNVTHVYYTHVYAAVKYTRISYSCTKHIQIQSAYMRGLFMSSVFSIVACTFKRKSRYAQAHYRLNRSRNCSHAK